MVDDREDIRVRHVIVTAYCALAALLGEDCVELLRAKTVDASYSTPSQPTSYYVSIFLSPLSICCFATIIGRITRASP
jgi:hypothetical protein